MVKQTPGLFEKLMVGCHGSLYFLVEYGSNSGQDTDYLAVFDELPRSSSLTAGGMDLWAISKSYFEKYTTLLDPFVSEPLLTGRLVYGSDEVFAKYKTLLMGQPVSTHAIRHLLCRSMELYVVSCQRVYTTVDSAVARREFWSKLSFSLSYWGYATCYANRSHGAVPLSTAIDACQVQARALWDDVQVRKQTAAKVDEGVLDRFARVLLKTE